MIKEKNIELKIKLPPVSGGADTISLYDLMWNSSAISDTRRRAYTQSENAGYARLEEQLSLMLSEDADTEEIMRAIMEYAALVEELSFTLGLKTGTALYRSLTEDLGEPA